MTGTGQDTASWSDIPSHTQERQCEDGEVQGRQYEDNIAKLQEEVEKAKEGKNTILALFGKGNLAKARKEEASKDKEPARLQTIIAKLEAEKDTLKQKHESDIAKLRNDYQKEAIIERQKNRIDELDRKANPQR